MQPSGAVFVEGGHYTLGHRTGEPVLLPHGERLSAETTESTLTCFTTAVEEVVLRRSRGERADLGLMVGDLGVPSVHRASGGPWAVPASYRSVLERAQLSPDEVVVIGEAFCRNQGKRRLLDEARTRAVSPEQTYTAEGWALLADPVGLRLASDASLEWEGDLKVVALTKARLPLCPLVFAGLKRWLFRKGYDVHLAIYALADDPYIDVKLRAGAAAVAQLGSRAIGRQEHRFIEGIEERFERDEFVAPGATSWTRFYERARATHPGLCRIEEAEWTQE